MVSPGLRVGREVARELRFADLGPVASAYALPGALSLAREGFRRWAKRWPRGSEPTGPSSSALETVLRGSRARTAR